MWRDRRDFLGPFFTLSTWSLGGLNIRTSNVYQPYSNNIKELFDYLTSRTFPSLSNPCDRPQRSHSQTCRFSHWVQVQLKVLVACPDICRVSGHDKKHGLRRMGHTVKMQAERLADFKIQRLVMLEKMSSCLVCLESKISEMQVHSMQF